MTENDIQNVIRLELSKHGVILFRANVGDFITQDGRYIKSALPRGFSDLFGVTNQGRAVFIEVKKPGYNKNTAHVKEQKYFIDRMKKQGALAGFVESVDDALKIIGGVI